jgi:hypothetical protein
MAADNAKSLRNWIDKQGMLELQVAEFNLRGVAAVNRNDLSAAGKNFRQAYALNPDDAFAINNIGFVAEIEGDRETAEFFYNNAQKARRATQKVGLATRRSAEGLNLLQVASENGTKVETRVAQDQEELRQRHAPVVLRHRDNTIVKEPATPPAKTAPAQQ